MASCNTKKSASVLKDGPVPKVSCPEGGDCTFELLRAKSLQFQQDEFGIGHLELKEGSSLVLHYSFVKSQKTKNQDDFYEEHLWLEIPEKEQNFILKDKEMMQVKAVFQRICFCKGQQGAFPLTQGELYLFHNPGTIKLKTSFKVDKRKQYINAIDEHLKYYK